MIVERRLGTEMGWGKVVGEEKAGREVTREKMEEAGLEQGDGGGGGPRVRGEDG